MSTASGAANGTNGEVAAPDVATRRAAGGDVLAARFLVALAAQRRAPVTRPLHHDFGVVAEPIVGVEPVHVAADVVARRALDAVGMRAATVDRTIYVRQQPVPTPAGAELIAHELTHVAHPSPLPRFFDDPRDGPEERRARVVGRAMRSAPVVARPPARSTAETARPAARSSGSAASDGVSAADLAGRISRDATSGAGGTEVRRFVRGRSPAPAAIGQHRRQAPPGDPPARSQDVPPVAPARSEEPSDGGGLAVDPWLAGMYRHFDRVIELLEDRIINEWERRGGRLRDRF